MRIRLLIAIWLTLALSLSALAADSYRPGERIARDNRITITDIRSNKVRYSENEIATTKATIVNKTGASEGTIIALMHLDVDTVREIARSAFSVGAGETRVWEFSYNVGPETYGRGIEVRFVDSDGTVRDTWQEFYAVAAEFFRVHQHSYQGQMKDYKVDFWTTYFNQSHYFASEPTDFGIQPFDALEFNSGQAGYAVNTANRQAQMVANRNSGVATTFYQTGAFCGQMGYEEVRKHPEYALYGADGEFAIDPVYGGSPNPMELASPIEIGPNRIVEKPYLDRKYRPWQHVAPNMAMEDAIVYGANAIKEYARARNFDGCYWDGTLGVSKGYSYDGTLNVPSDKYEDYVRLSARNHRIYSDILKQDNPNFGTWFNWGLAGVEGWTRAGFKWYLGTGISEQDPKDDAIRAVTQWNNVMILNEMQNLGTGTHSTPRSTLDALLADRDKFVQELGANILIGYMDFKVAPDEPGPTKWGWPTVNYFLAQLTATQHHLASFFVPSFHPSFQFMTRYSRFIWARDVKAVGVSEVEKTLKVTSPEEILWKKLVYRRATDDGYDLIVHLVRIPPTKKWDASLAAEPSPLQGVTITANLAGGQIEDVQAMRPHYYEEDQQPLQTVLQTINRGGKATVDIPAFRYNTMVVVRVKIAR